MLTNLFSMFDVSLAYMNPFLFMFMVSIMIIMAKNMEKMKIMNVSYSVLSLMTKTLLIQFSFGNKKDMVNKMKNMKHLMLSKMPVSIFTFVLICNFFSLFPHVMSVTSHMSLNLALTIVIWLLSFTLAITNNFKSFLAHMTPSGTPMALMSFMVLIETISNIIRPLTLAVRLMANMVAGHLLLTLLSKFSLLALNLTVLSSPIMFILTILEMAVSLIQSYVITLLSILYLKEAFS